MKSIPQKSFKLFTQILIVFASPLFFVESADAQDKKRDPDPSTLKVFWRIPTHTPWLEIDLSKYFKN